MITLWLSDPTPSPLPGFDGDPDMVTPGVLGFVVTFLIAVATVLLAIDMVRRVRRVRYREEIREELEAEVAARDARAAGAVDGSVEPTASSSDAPDGTRPGDSG